MTSHTYITLHMYAQTILYFFRVATSNILIWGLLPPFLLNDKLLCIRM